MAKDSGADEVHTRRVQHFRIAARIGGILAIVLALLLFIAAKLFIDVMADFPIPGDAPVERMSTLNDLLLAAGVCGALALCGVGLVLWSFRQRRTM